MTATEPAAPHNASDGLPPVLVVLGPGRSFTTVTAGMLGQHPELFGVPELNLNFADTVGDWLAATEGTAGAVRHGILRVYSQLATGAQTDAGVAEAMAWLQANAAMPTADLFALVRREIAPRALVEKSPYTATRDDLLGRLSRQLPDAKYIHITRHPWTACHSMMDTVWYRALLRTGHAESYDRRGAWPIFDPQVHWYDCHERIAAFLQTVPAERKILLRGEDLLEDPAPNLQRICAWAGLDATPAAIDAMLHPEHSPFACRGPDSAPWGADPSFQDSPQLRPYQPKPGYFRKPLPWRPDGAPLDRSVVEMARSFGYSGAD